MYKTSGTQFGTKRIRKVWAGTLAKKYASKAVIKTTRPSKKVLSSYVKVPMRSLPRSARPEVKKFDSAFWSAETIDNAANWSFNDRLLTISKGDNIDNRTGNKIFVKYITANLWISNSVDAQDARVRLLVIKDKEPAAAASATPSFSTIFENQATDLLDLCAPISRANSGRYQILKDKYIPLKSLCYYAAAVTTGTGVSPSLVHMKFKIPVNKYVSYDSASDTVTGGCQIYITAYSDRTNNTPQVNMVTRTYFTDA